ncbi:universal stress protein [Luedemannella helvata]|uniref:Universal stress protein n=1 Tax=Luedemannella helvata TaxID=349315 RepID=A0ABN2K2X7_9ACTN
MSEAFTGVVVGVDGGPSGNAATELAADTAARYGEPLCLLHVLQLAPAVGMAAPYANHFDEWRAASEELLTALADGLREKYPELTVVTRVVVGNPSGTLIDASQSARLLVVGCRGRGGFAELLLGSVSSQVAAHAKCPVIVVRPADEQARPHPGLPVVVGVDGSALSAAAVGLAFAEADTRRVPLVVQHVWWAPDYAAGDGQIDPVALEAEATRIVAESVEGWSDKYPNVAVETRLTHSADAEAEMIETSTHASLVVVGSRGRGGFRGLLLGSVSQALVHHAECPVAIVRTVPPERV